MRFFPDLANHLAEQGVRFIVVGGLAVVLSGYQRMTGDVDIVLAMDSDNIRRAVRVFREEGLVPRADVNMEDFVNAEVRASWIVENGFKAFGLFNPCDPTIILDVILDECLDYEDLERESNLLPIGKATVPVASVRHLIEMKENAGREKDLLDIQALRKMEND